MNSKKYFMFRYAVSYAITVFVKSIQVLFANHVKRDQKKNPIQNKYITDMYIHYFFIFHLQALLFFKNITIINYNVCDLIFQLKI